MGGCILDSCVQEYRSAHRSEHHFILPISILYLKQYNYVMYQTCIIT